ncbi:MAG TPA: DUF4401 domain-containing protein [Burkholderiales bacterium]|nr:DUF4401 domain-containing protein [Burkholderiales bacterium]
MSALTREALWERLRAASLVEGEAPAPDEQRSPWFVRLMLGFAGWMGALFLLLFVGIALAVVVRSAALSVAVGAGACFAATAIFRAARGDFASQFGFAVSLAGQGLIGFGLSQLLGARSLASAAALSAVVQAALFALVPNYGHRIWCAFTAAYAAALALANAGLQPFVPALVTGAFLAVWLREFERPERGELVRAAGYGLAAAALFAAVLQGGLWHGLMGLLGERASGPGRALGWAGAVASGAVLVAAVLALLRREGVPPGSRPGRFALGAAALLALISLKAPGLGPAVAILVVGYANGNRVLAGAGIAALIGYLSHYYYSLQATLLEKSALLAAAGIALLLLRLALHRWWPPKDAHA